MPTLRYKGDFGSSVTLAAARTTALTAEDAIPSSPIVVQSAYARIYVSTTAKAYTFKYHVETNGGYDGDLDYNFSENDSPVYVNVPIDVTALDPNFPIKTINTITVSETGGHGSNTRIRGTVRIFVEYSFVGSPTAPSNIRINGETAINLQAGHTATLTWNAGAVGNYDTFVAYNVQRYNKQTGEWTLVGTTGQTSMTITAPYTDSESYDYFVIISTRYFTTRSSVSAGIYTFIPLTEPVFLNGGTHVFYNPRPMLLVTLGDGPREENLTLVAQGWTPSRKALPGEKVYLRRNSFYQAEDSETITVTETDERVRSIDTTVSVTYEPPEYTNEEIIAGGTIVRAADITELQEYLANIRDSYGMTAFTFTPCVAGVTSLDLWTTHIAELQTCIRQIQSFINSWDLASVSYAVILPKMISSIGPSAAVITQLRQIVTML